MLNGTYFVRTFMMFSATLDPKIKQLAQNYLKHFAYVQIGDLGSAKKEIQQRIEFVHGP